MFEVLEKFAQWKASLHKVPKTILFLVRQVHWGSNTKDTRILEGPKLVG